MPEELNPCPFCGGEARIIGCPQCNEVFAECQNCGIMTGAKLSREQVILDWNRRAAPENKPLTLDELQGMDGEPVWIAWDDIGWEKVVLIDGYPRIAAVVNHGSGYQCHLYTPYDIDGTSHAYAHKPEGST